MGIAQHVILLAFRLGQRARYSLPGECHQIFNLESIHSRAASPAGGDKAQPIRTKSDARESASSVNFTINLSRPSRK